MKKKPIEIGNRFVHGDVKERLFDNKVQDQLVTTTESPTDGDHGISDKRRDQDNYRRSHHLSRKSLKLCEHTGEHSLHLSTLDDKFT